MSDPHLSEQRYVSGLQCDRRLWLDVHAPDERAPNLESRQHIFRMHGEVREAARSLFSDGVVVTAPPADHELAFDQTRALIADASVGTIFDAAFEFDGIRIRIDALERLGNGSARFGIRTVTSATHFRDAEDLPGLALAKWVLTHCGLSVPSVELIHVNPEFVRGVGAINPRSFFSRVEVASRIGQDELNDVGTRLDSMAEIAAQKTMPDKEPGDFCRRTHLCEYWDSCTAAKSAAWFTDRVAGHSDQKSVMREVAESQKVWVSDSFEGEIEALRSPFWTLEFGVIGPAIPLFEQTLPYQPITFQWSLHRRSEDGRSKHFEFLADAGSDPRFEVARRLVEILESDEAPILVYSGYELRRIKELAAFAPEFEGALNGIATRLVDLLPIVRRNVYHPDFLGSYSLNYVAPALVPTINYGGTVDAGEGSAPVAAFVRLASGKSKSREAVVDRTLLCDRAEHNTWVLAEVFRALRELASDVKPLPEVDGKVDRK